MKDAEPDLNFGVIMECFHSSGSSCRSMKLRNRSESEILKMEKHCDRILEEVDPDLQQI